MKKSDLKHIDKEFDHVFTKGQILKAARGASKTQTVLDKAYDMMYHTSRSKGKYKKQSVRSKKKGSQMEKLRTTTTKVSNELQSFISFVFLETVVVYSAYQYFSGDVVAIGLAAIVGLVAVSKLKVN